MLVDRDPEARELDGASRMPCRWTPPLIATSARGLLRFPTGVSGAAIKIGSRSIDDAIEFMKKQGVKDDSPEMKQLTELKEKMGGKSGK